MKKILLTIAIIITLTINVSAQYKPFQFGLKIEPGIGWAKLNFDHLNDASTKMNFSWGFTGNFYFVENYGISTGFNVRYMNNEYSFEHIDDLKTGKTSTITRTIKNQYLEIPIGLSMRTEKIGDFRILGGIGYGLGILLNQNDTDIDNNGIERDIPTKYNNVRNSLIIKLGAEYYVHKSSCFTLALVYNNNFTNIYKRGFEHNILLNNLGLEIGFIF